MYWISRCHFFRLKLLAETTSTLLAFPDYKSTAFGDKNVYYMAINRKVVGAFKEVFKFDEIIDENHLDFFHGGFKSEADCPYKCDIKQYGDCATSLAMSPATQVKTAGTNEYTYYSGNLKY